VTYHPARMTAQELQSGYDQLIRRLFTYPAMLRRIVRAGAYMGWRAHGFLPTNVVYRRLCHPALKREPQPFVAPLGRPAGRRARELRSLGTPAFPARAAGQVRGR